MVFAYLFGSFVRGGPARDVDVAVWLRGGVDPLEYVLETGLRLELAAGAPVDLVVLNEAPVTLRYAVFREGHPLLIRDHALHDLVEAETILMYSELRVLRRYASGCAAGHRL